MATTHTEIDQVLTDEDMVDIGIITVAENLLDEAGFVVKNTDYTKSSVQGRIDGNSVDVRVNKNSGYGDKEILVSPVSKEFGPLNSKLVAYKVDDEVDTGWSGELFRALRDVWVNF